MNSTLRARAEARVVDPDSSASPRLADFCSQLNQLIAPKRQLGPGEIHVKAIYLISDARNAFGGKVPPDELQRLRALCLNVPVLIGHQKQSLPLGRTFRAELVRDDDQTWLKVWFYWLRDNGSGDRLRAEIDSGIVSEASISFAFDLPECEKCGKDFRFCPHDGGSGGAEGFVYREIQRVLEISLVYRGAVSGTRIVDARDGDEFYSGVKLPSDDIERADIESVDRPRSARFTPGFRLWYKKHEDSLAYLSVCDGLIWRHWLIPQFSLPHMNRGARFVAQPLNQPPLCFEDTPSDSGLAKVSTNARAHLHIECAGNQFIGQFVVRPTRINHNGSQIIYRSTSGSPEETSSHE